MIDKYAVIGNPIEHSRSPEIHQAFALQTGRSIDFKRLKAPVDGFKDAIGQFIEEGGKGLSVTMPFKQDAFGISDSLSQRAQRAAAVNTLIIRNDGGIQGDNTDGPGLVADIKSNLSWEIRDHRVLILGAGGAVRGILESLSLESPSELVIANRTESKAHSLAEEFSALADIKALSIQQLADPFDLVINATGASLSGSNLDISKQVISSHTNCYDLTYSAEETKFNQWAKQAGAHAYADGLGMLVEQAAIAFRLWHQVLPDTKPVLSAIRASMHSKES